MAWASKARTAYSSKAVTKIVTGIRSTPDRLDDAEAVELRHLHVEEDQVGLRRVDRRHRLAAGGAHAHHLDVGFERQQADQAVPGHRLVVDDQRANRRVRS